MCGIWAYIQSNKGGINVPQCFNDFYQLKHRGPTNSYFETYENVCIGFHRLAIMDDTFQSNQPFIFEDEHKTIIFICNGEIYNFKKLIEYYELDPTIKNDCFVIPAIYMQLCQRKQEHEFINVIKNTVEGEFAFVLFEFDHAKTLQKIIVCRDEVGIRPLYYSPDVTADSLLFTSEIKGGASYPGTLAEFPPGHMLTYHMDGKKVTVDSVDYSSIYNIRPPLCVFDERLETLWGEYQPTDNEYLEDIRAAITESVNRRLVADKPIAFLLSGGVDSSLVAALASRSLGTSICTFCCGMEEGTDLKYARDVATKIGSYHTEVIFTPEQGLAVIPDVIRTIESWDTTTVRASVGQYLVSQYISTHTDCKVVLVGEGPDEVCSSYLFNWYAPNGEALDKTAKEYVKKIHYFDVKRADRCISRWGLEGRVPLLDPEFIRSYWSLHYEERMPAYRGMEKWWLRKPFEGMDLLPEHVLTRRKEAFSDGVSGHTSWFQIIQNFVADKVTDEEMAAAAITYPYCTPTTKEAYYYRKLFCEFFGERRQEVIPHYWQPKWDANGKEVSDYVDPSARTLAVYQK
jgi:asparagine synthase (glutamine-hydrolysing)